MLLFVVTALFSGTLCYSLQESIGVGDPNLFERDMILAAEQRVASEGGKDMDAPVSGGSTRRGFCRDTGRYCHYHVPRGDCNRMQIVRRRCRKSCGLCGGGSGCRDTGRYCYYHVPRGDCKRMQIVRERCKKSCGLCGGGTPPPPTTTPPLPPPPDTLPPPPPGTMPPTPFPPDTMPPTALPGTAPPTSPPGTVPPTPFPPDTMQPTPFPPDTLPPSPLPPETFPPTLFPPETFPPTLFPPETLPPSPFPPDTLPPPAKSCGVSLINSGRVIGGDDAAPGAWPWQVGLHTNRGGFFCGGTLVTPEWVVTAAHCISTLNPSNYVIRLGDHNRHRSEGTEQNIRASRVIKHPNYDSRRTNNDIALIKLSRPANINDRVSTACLPSANYMVPPGTTCYITGWGKIRHPGNSHHILQQAKITPVSESDCKRKNGYGITRQMLCAGVPGTRLGGCHGDSGGPFVCKSPGGFWVLQGAVSWGSNDCNAHRMFTVFARVAMFREWIDQYIA